MVAAFQNQLFFSNKLFVVPTFALARAVALAAAAASRVRRCLQSLALDSPSVTAH
jgi:hypothetical protein